MVVLGKDIEFQNGCDGRAENEPPSTLDQSTGGKTRARMIEFGNCQFSAGRQPKYRGSTPPVKKRRTAKVQSIDPAADDTPSSSTTWKKQVSDYWDKKLAETRTYGKGINGKVFVDLCAGAEGGRLRFDCRSGPIPIHVTETQTLVQGPWTQKRI